MDMAKKATRKKRVLVLVDEYPQISQTYIKNELDVLYKDYDVEIVSRQPGNYPFRSRQPHIVLTQNNAPNVMSYLKRFAPDVIHAHYAIMIPTALQFAEILKVPFTIRAHSFDVIRPETRAQIHWGKLGQHPLFKGIVVFPFVARSLIDAGLPEEKVVSCPPIVDVQRFRNLDPNGEHVMNVGAAIPKKNVEDFIKLSTLVPSREFNYYGMGYKNKHYIDLNAQTNGRVNFISAVEPEEMPPEYKKHSWLVYTASHALNAVGWPMALIEAQASGVGVCVQNIRPDIKDFVGDTGHLFEKPEDIADTLQSRPSDKDRKRAYEWAEQYDYRAHMHKLTDLWQ
jgi:glycosyltransferase involved in cell wall biosynthesis